MEIYDQRYSICDSITYHNEKKLLLENIVGCKDIIVNWCLSRCKGFRYNYYHEKSNANIQNKINVRSNSDVWKGKRLSHIYKKKSS